MVKYLQSQGRFANGTTIQVTFSSLDDSIVKRSSDEEVPPARRVPFAGVEGCVTRWAQVQNLLITLTRPTYWQPMLYTWSIFHTSFTKSTNIKLISDNIDMYHAVLLTIIYHPNELRPLITHLILLIFCRCILFSKFKRESVISQLQCMYVRENRLNLKGEIHWRGPLAEIEFEINWIEGWKHPPLEQLRLPCGE